MSRLKVKVTRDKKNKKVRHFVRERFSGGGGPLRRGKNHRMLCSVLCFIVTALKSQVKTRFSAVICECAYIIFRAQYV